MKGRQKILVVEDNFATRTMLEHTLELEGYDVVALASGSMVANELAGTCPSIGPFRRFCTRNPRVSVSVRRQRSPVFLTPLIPGRYSPRSNGLAGDCENTLCSIGRSSSLWKSTV